MQFCKYSFFFFNFVANSKHCVLHYSNTSTVMVEINLKKPLRFFSKYNT